MVTVYSDPGRTYAVEEDRQGRLWLTIDLGNEELHRLLTPGEARDFQSGRGNLEAKVRYMKHTPDLHRRKDEEREYRAQ